MPTLFVAQPPAPYVSQQPLVVDASVLAAAVFDEDERELALNWMRGRSLAAPQLVDYEITNIALTKLRSKQVDSEAAVQALALFAALDIERVPIAMDGVFALAAQCNLTAYDAAYLWLAAQRKVPLATFDGRLGQAAKIYLAALGSPGSAS